jgi:hypothetical protein
LSPRTLRLELAASPLLASAIAASHALAAACVLITMPGAPGALAAAALVTLGALAAWSRALHRARASVRALQLEGPRLTLVMANGDSLSAEVAARRYVGRLVVILCLRQPVRRTILVTRDMLAGDAFRRLRIWALWGRLPAVAAKQLPA